MRIATAFERFIRHVEPSDTGCWLWIGALSPGGYGVMWSGGHGNLQAHRWSYEYFVETVPDGRELDHLCRVRNCVHPWHVEPVTRRENFLRGEHWAAVAYRTNTCRKGHSLTDAYWSRGWRTCRTCLLSKYNPAARHQRYLRTGA